MVLDPIHHLPKAHGHPAAAAALAWVLIDEREDSIKDGLLTQQQPQVGPFIAIRLAQPQGEQAQRDGHIRPASRLPASAVSKRLKSNCPCKTGVDRGTACRHSGRAG